MEILKPTIVVISTGGTIAMRYDPIKGGHVLAVCGNELVSTVPPLAEVANVEVMEFANIPSFHMTPEIMLRLAREVETILARPEVQGVVVTHGTDTLEETAYFLDLYLPASKCVCVTGAIRSGDHVSPDGPCNILCSVRVAASARATEHGVLVVMNGEIHEAERVTKTDTSAVQTFSSPYWGPAGHVLDDRILLSPPLPRRPPLRPETLSARVPIVKIYTGMDEEILAAVTAMEPDGLVLEGYGKGNVPDSVIPAVKQILEKGIPVVITSRAQNGPTLAVYAADGGCAHLKSLGVIVGGTLNSQKARIKLQLALGVNKYPDDLRGLFQEIEEHGAL